MLTHEDIERWRTYIKLNLTKPDFAINLNAADELCNLANKGLKYEGLKELIFNYLDLQLDKKETVKDKDGITEQFSIRLIGKESGFRCGRL